VAAQRAAAGRAQRRKGLLIAGAASSLVAVDVGNQYLLPQAQYLPSALQGMSWSQVAAAMRNPNSPVARDIDGAANVITAAICKLTNGQPAGVCTSAGVSAAAGKLQASS